MAGSNSFSTSPGRFCPLPGPNSERFVCSLYRHWKEVLSMKIQDYKVTGEGQVRSPGLIELGNGPGLRAEICGSILGNRPQASSNSYVHRTSKGGISHKKTRHCNHPRDASAGKEQHRDLPGRGHPIQYHPRPCSPSSRNLRRQVMPELWPSHGSALWPEGETFLLR